MSIRKRSRIKKTPQKTKEVFEILKLRAAEQKTVYYGDIASQVGLSNEGVSHPLGWIFDHCKKLGLPELNAIAINRKNKQPGPGYPGSRDSWAQDTDRVFSFNWDKVTFDTLLYGKESV